MNTNVTWFPIIFLEKHGMFFLALILFMCVRKKESLLMFSEVKYYLGDKKILFSNSTGGIK